MYLFKLINRKSNNLYTLDDICPEVWRIACWYIRRDVQSPCVYTYESLNNILQLIIHIRELERHKVRVVMPENFSLSSIQLVRQKYYANLYNLSRLFNFHVPCFINLGHLQKNLYTSPKELPMIELGSFAPKFCSDK